MQIAHRLDIEKDQSDLQCKAYSKKTNTIVYTDCLLGRQLADFLSIAKTEQIAIKLSQPPIYELSQPTS